MPHFFVQQNEDGRIAQIFRDGVHFEGGVSLELPSSISSIYFQSARLHLEQMDMEGDAMALRQMGLQAFLMSLVGLEAFTNTYFQLVGHDQNNEAILDRVEQRHGTLTTKIVDLIELSLPQPIVNQDALIETLFVLYQLRNDVAHPRWEPSSLTLAEGEIPIVIHGLVQNFQAVFENVEYCREAHYWCLLLVARVAEAWGNQDIGSFMFRWTGNYNLTLQMIAGALDLPE